MNENNEKETVAEFIQANSGKSEAELMDQLKSITDAEREAGTMNDTKLEEIYGKLYPYLTQAQRQKMEQVIARLKS